MANDYEEDKSRLAECQKTGAPPGTSRPADGKQQDAPSAMQSQPRPRTRPLTILELPDELLAEIFELTRLPSGCQTQLCPPVDAILSLRATCRRFYTTSSHLFMRELVVRPTKASITRLDKISQHPNLSTGIRCIKVSVGPYYDFRAAHDLAFFAAYQRRIFQDHLSVLAYQLVHHQSASYFSQVTLQLGIREANALIDSFWHIAEDGIDGIDASCLGHCILVEAQARYRKGYQDQQKMQQSLAQAVVSAMPQLPATTSLELLDQLATEHTPGAKSIAQDMLAPKALINRMSAPSPWDHMVRHAFDPPPFQFVPDMLFSMQQAGISLKSIHLATPPPPDHAFPVSIAGDDVSRLRSAVQRLQSFTFCPRHDVCYDFWANGELTMWSPFKTFLSIMIDTASLECIHLDFHAMFPSYARPSLSMADMLANRTWPSMRDLSFTGPFHLTDLQIVAQGLPKTATLKWTGYLLDGSWATVLDIIKDHGRQDSEVPRFGMSAAGQECDDMTNADLDIIFESCIFQGKLFKSQATLYVQNSSSQTSNPIRNWQDNMNMR